MIESNSLIFGWSTEPGRKGSWASTGRGIPGEAAIRVVGIKAAVPIPCIRTGVARAPTWALGETLLRSRDTDFRLRIIKVLAALGEVDLVRVVGVLCEASKERRDPEVKRAAATALMVFGDGAARGPSPSPPGRPAPPDP